MKRKLPIKFALGVGLAVLVALVRPEWFTDGLLGGVLVMYTAVMSILIVFALLVAATDLFARPENRLTESTPWIDLVASVVGLGVLLWIVYATNGRQLGNVIALSSVMIGLAMYGFTRWNAARVRHRAA